MVAQHSENVQLLVRYCRSLLQYLEHDCVLQSTALNRPMWLHIGVLARVLLIQTTGGCPPGGL